MLRLAPGGDAAHRGPTSQPTQISSPGRCLNYSLHLRHLKSTQRVAVRTSLRCDTFTISTDGSSRWQASRRLPPGCWHASRHSLLTDAASSWASFAIRSPLSTHGSRRRAWLESSGEGILQTMVPQDYHQRLACPLCPGISWASLVCPRSR